MVDDMEDQAYKHRSTDKIAKQHRYHVRHDPMPGEGRARDRTAVACLDQHGQGEQVDIGNAVFEGGGHEGGDRKDDCNGFVDHAAAGERHPHRHAHQRVAQHAAKKAFAGGKWVLVDAIWRYCAATAPLFIAW